MIHPAVERIGVSWRARRPATGNSLQRAKMFLREHLHPDYFFDQNGSFLRKMSVWKPSPSIYITYQEPEYDKKIKFSQNSPKSLSGAVQLLGDHIFSVLVSSFLGSANSSRQGLQGQPVPIAAAQQPSGLGMLVLQLSQGPSYPVNLLFLQFRPTGPPTRLHRAQLIHLFRGSDFRLPFVTSDLVQQMILNDSVQPTQEGFIGLALEFLQLALHKSSRFPEPPHPPDGGSDTCQSAIGQCGR